MDFTPQTINVSELVNLINQTFDYNFGKVLVEGELANFRISKNQWVYFDLKDDKSTVKFFGTLRQLHFPMEDGMLIRVFSYPHLHSNYGMSMQVEAIELVGEGSIKRAALLLKQKLEKEGLFALEKKRKIPFPPLKIGLITSMQSAAYQDFIKILNNRFRGIEIDVMDVQVQGYLAVSQIVGSINKFNNLKKKYDCLVIIRGGGSPEDLAAFNEELLVRAVSISKIPTVLAIGHEIDVSLAELAADLHASTPSNAAELLVPEIKVILNNLNIYKQQLNDLLKNTIEDLKNRITDNKVNLSNLLHENLNVIKLSLINRKEVLDAYDPENILSRGFAVVNYQNKVLKNSKDIDIGEYINIRLHKGEIKAEVKGVANE